MTDVESSKHSFWKSLSKCYFPTDDFCAILARIIKISHVKLQINPSF